MTIIRRLTDWLRYRKLRRELIDSKVECTFVRRGHYRKDKHGCRYFVKSAIVVRDTRSKRNADASNQGIAREITEERIVN
mgnify:CR=1 FL=1